MQDDAMQGGPNAGGPADNTAKLRSSVPWLAIAGLIFTLGIYALNSGFVFPANTLLMTSLGYSAAAVGAVGSAGAVGYILGSLAAPLLAAAIGLRRTAVGAVLVTALLIVGFAVIPPVLAWYPMRLVHGMATTTLFICGESALIALAPDALRGRIVGFYTAFNSAFFAIGPVLVAELGFKTLLPYALVASIIALLAVPLILQRDIAPALPAVPLRQIARSVAGIPMLLAVIFAWGWIDGETLNLLSVYATQRGASAEHASWLLSLLAVGNVFLQFPIGWLADHLSRRHVLAGLAALGVAGALLLPLVDLSGRLIVVHLVLLGAVGFGTFTVSLIALGDALNGAELVAANAAFGLLWGLGNFAGALGTGWLMDTVGTIAFPLALACGFLVQCVAALVLPLSSKPGRSPKL